MLYVADSCNNVIRAVDLQAGMGSTLAGTVNLGGLVDMPGAAARFNLPQASPPTVRATCTSPATTPCATS